MISSFSPVFPGAGKTGRDVCVGSVKSSVRAGDSAGLGVVGVGRPFAALYGDAFNGEGRMGCVGEMDLCEWIDEVGLVLVAGRGADSDLGEGSLTLIANGSAFFSEGENPRPIVWMPYDDFSVDSSSSSSTILNSLSRSNSLFDFVLGGSGVPGFRRTLSESLRPKLANRAGASS